MSCIKLDISVTRNHITWPRTLKKSELMLFWRHHRQRKDHIKGSIETKISKRHYLWRNTKGYCVVSSDNTVQIWRKPLWLLPN